MPDNAPTPEEPWLKQIKQLKDEIAALKQESFESGLSAQLRAILDNIPIRAFWKDTNSVYQGANATFLYDAGIQSFDDIVGKTDFDLPWTEHQAELFRHDDKRVMESGEPDLNIEESQTRADGITGWLRTSKIPLKDDSGHVYGILGTYEDITDLKLQQRALEASEQRFKMLYNQTSHLMGLLTPMGNMIAGNDTVMKRFNLTEEGTAGKYFPDAPFWSHDAYERDKVINGIAQALKGETTQFLTNNPTPQGDIIFVEFSIKPIFDASGQVEMLLVEGHEVTEAIHNQRRLEEAKNKLRELNETLERRVAERTEQLESNNKVLSSTLERLNRTQTELAESEKMASLGSLVSGFSHEVNTPIGIAVTAGSMIGDELKSLRNLYQNGEMARSNLESFFDKADEGVLMLIKNLKRASELISSFKQVAVDQASDVLRPIELTSYIHEVINSLHPKFKRTNISVEVESSEQIELITYPGNIAQIITNLFINSITHAFEGIAKPEIKIHVEKHRSADSISLVYQDNGVGMNESVLQHVFEPFFTTRREDGGSGLGMNIVYKLVTQKLQGKISCESEFGHGVKFKITLPVKLNLPDS
ncbi:PAS domain-containing sensor histidine kinase [Reinekea marinisedimentorum]|uniref:histidine kinase n=1 Tax=Reinekea marinisedimentorum TaxID=230495 RepID=A0A4R3HUL6_9GAMM|nr:PAS domain-containing protein [Reinekea marinisedimentorum]TCS35871.1 PAS domain S-box-containing protein [Reinekea marinisedimentorum]